MNVLKSTLLALFAGIASIGMSQNIKLPPPQKTGGKPLMEALNERQSSREFVADLKKVTDKNREDVIAAIHANTGFIAQNVYLYCASANLNCVVRAMIDRAALSKELGLKSDDVITLAQSVGIGKVTK